MNEYLINLGSRSKKASKILATKTTEELNGALNFIAQNLIKNADEILCENKKDIEYATQKGVKASLIDRLKLTYERIVDIANGLNQVATLSSPIGEVLYSHVKENGLKATTEKEAYAFAGYLEKAGLSATVRRLNGADIEGACGQLRRSYLND